MSRTDIEQLIGHRYVELDGVRLHYVEAGTGPLVILLHGFPDFWYSWRHQIPALVAAGYRVVAPDMRGYNLSGKPASIAAYRGEHLAGDVAGLIRAVGADRAVSADRALGTDRALGADRAVVVGHDWGAAVAWEFAMRYPELLDRLVILNVPHPARMLRGLRTWRQLLKSWYMFFFQLPGLPEAAIRAGNYASLRRLFRTDPCRPNAFTPADIERYVAAAAQPGALTAAINYYRALFRSSPAAAQRTMRRIATQVLVIWGEQDRYLGRELAEPDHEWVPHARVERLPHASHWVQHDDPERVNALLLEFLKQQ